MYVTVFLCMCAIAGVKGAEDSPFRWKRHKYIMPWLKGPNMCAVQEVMATRKQFYSECMFYKPRTICGRPTSLRYMCCSGFEKINENDKGCKGVIPLDNLYNTIDDMSLQEMRNVAQQTGLNDTLINEGTFTVFVPDNKAFRSMSQETRKKILRSIKDKKEPSLLLNHVTRDRHGSLQLRNNRKLTTLYSNEQDVQIHRYSNGIVTANCARMILTNQKATNGIIHVVDRVIEPLTNKKSIFDELAYDGENRFGELITSLIVTGVGEELRNENQQFTIFAPTDAAFRKLPPGLLDRIIRRKDHEALKSLLRYHIIPRPICSAAIIDQGTMTTLEGSKMNLSCAGNDRLHANGATISKADILASNGVIHAVDDVLIPESVRSLGEVAKDLKLNRFTSYARRAGLGDVLEGSVNRSFTLFAPSDKAFHALTADQVNLLQNPEALQRVIKYHVVPGEVTTSRIIDQQKRESILGLNEFKRGPSVFGDKGADVRFTVNRGGFGFNSAKIVGKDHVARHGVIQIIDRVVFPPEETLIEIIKSRPNLSEFYGLLQAANGKYEKVLESPHSKMTVFVPSNEAFDATDSVYLDETKANEEKLLKTINYHLLNNAVYSNNIEPNLRFRFRTRAADWLELVKSKNDIQVNNDVKISEADILATNGVVHVIDTLLRRSDDVTSGSDA